MHIYAHIYAHMIRRVGRIYTISNITFLIEYITKAGAYMLEDGVCVT